MSELTDKLSDETGHTVDRAEFLKNFPDLAADEASWRKICFSLLNVFLKAYEHGDFGPAETGYKILLDKVWKCSTGCHNVASRFQIMGIAGARALRITPREHLARRPPVPLEIELSIVNLVKMIESDFPELPKSPSRSGKQTVLSVALRYLEAMDLNYSDQGQFNEQSVYDIVRKHSQGPTESPIN